MKNYNILIAIILISILTGCGEKKYIGDKVEFSTAKSLMVVNDSFFEQIRQAKISRQEQEDDINEANLEKGVSESTGWPDEVYLNQTKINDVLKECNKILQNKYQISSDCQITEGYFYLETEGTLLECYSAKSEFVVLDGLNNKKYQISIDGTEKLVQIKETTATETIDTLQTMPWNTVLAMVEALDFGQIAEDGDDYILLHFAGEIDVGSNGVNPVSAEGKRFYYIEDGKMIPAEEKKLRGKQYALELTGAVNSEEKELTVNSSVDVKHVVGVFMER